MNRTPVKSSRVISIGHEGSILEVEFNGGSVYQYSPVPKETYTRLVNSHQVGKDIQAIIKDAGVTCVKL